MSTHKWTHIDSNGRSSPAGISPSLFELSAPPKTDIWRPSRAQDDFNAPYIYTNVTASQFKRLSVTISMDGKTRYDQGGILMLWPQAAARNERRWIKAGIEFEGAPMLSVVGCDRFSDWSLCPLPDSGASGVTVEARREGTSLWVYYVSPHGEPTPLREIRWAFVDVAERDEELWVGVGVAKPTPDSDDANAEVSVTFANLELEIV